MKEKMIYAQSDVKRCAAKIRPSYCQYEGNPCCFSCDKNQECTELALRDHFMKPCKPEVSVIMENGDLEKVQLFDEVDVCEFSI